MKKELLRFILYATIIYLIGGALNPALAVTHPLARNGTHFCGVIDDQWNKRYSDQFPNRHYARRAMANLNVGEPRTVRLIYFLPNDRPYRAEMVQEMKDQILKVQTFYAEQMEAHGYGRRTFRIETDAQGEPVVHRVDGREPNSDYQRGNGGDWLSDIEQAGFDITANVYFIVMDLTNDEGGFGGRWGKNGGEARLLGNVWFAVAAHELGHAFGLQHDFHDGAYIMSYGPGRTRLSPCHAEFLSVHPCFNPNISTKKDDPPTIELISSTRYTAGAKRVPVRLKISGSARLHQAILFATTVPTTGRHSITAGFPEVKACHGLVGNRDTVVEFDYDGVIPVDRSTSLSNPVVHPMGVNVVDMNGNVGRTHFVLFSEALQPLTKISGDNLQGLPNTPLPVPFVVELRDLNDGFPRYEVWVTFTVTAGGGTLSVERVGTNHAGRAESTLTLGPNLGTNTVEVSAEGHTVTFNAVAGAPVDIPDANLRAAIEDALGQTPGTPIAPAEIATLTRLEARNRNISDLTGLEGATNLTELRLHRNAISDLSPVAELTNLTVLEIHDNNISDLSPVANLINLKHLELPKNNVSDISAVSGLTNLAVLNLEGNAISDISAVAGLTRLTRLKLSNNAISDVSPLLGLNLIGLPWDSTGLYIEDNPLSYLSIHTHIPALQSREIVVQFDNRTPAPLLNISGVITASNNVLIVEARDSNGRVLEGVPVTFTVTSGGGTLSVTSAITDGKGRAQSTLTLGSDGDTNIVRASVEGISESVTFSDVQANIPNFNLRAAIEEALGKKEGVPIAPGEMAVLTRLEVPNANISDLTGLEFATNLTYLDLGYVTEGRRINSNSASNLSPLSGLTKLIRLNLWGNGISDISPLERLTNLTQLDLSDNSISDISPVAELTNLTHLDLDGNPLSDISAVTGLTNLTFLDIWRTPISDISPVAGLTNLTTLGLGSNSISDLTPLIANTGLGSGDKVYVRGNPLSYQSIHTHIPTLQSRGVTVEFDNRAHSALLKTSGDNQNGASFVSLSQPFVVEAQDANGSALVGIPVTFAVVAGGGTLSTTITRTDTNGRAQSTLILGPNLGANTVSVSASGIENPATFYAIADTLPTEFLWSIPPGISLIHVPLRVTAVRGVETTVASISDLYDVLGGANAVQFLTTYDSQAQDWRSYFGASDTSADVRLANDTGIMANLKAPVSLHLSGTPLGTDGSGTINLNQGLNLVGLPLRDPRIQRVSDLFTLDGIGGNVPVIILTDNGDLRPVGRAGDPEDITITGGQGFMMTAQRAATVTLSGDGWYNAAGTSVAPQVALKGIEVKHTTPVLALRGALVDKGAGLKVSTFRVTVKNLSTGRAVATAATPDEAGYQLTVVDIETGRAATVGDILEIVAKSPDPSVGIQPLRYTVTAEDVKRSYIQLPDLVAYEIPAETELLPNYPNPFNPETWIPYRLAEDAFVTLTIYDLSGYVVRRIDVGHRIASAYENQSKAIYWDGRNALGEQVASGVYFYALSAGDFSATRKMLILK